MSVGRRAGRRSLLACLLVAAAAVDVRGQTPAHAKETLVMPFDGGEAGGKLTWLGEGAAVVLSEYLERYGATAVPREDRLSAFERLQLPPAAALSHATVIRIGHFVGAADVVIGSYAVVGDHVTIRARSLQLDAGRLTAEVQETGAVAEVLAVFDRTARRLRGAAAPAPDPAPGTLLSSVHAVELFVRGLIAESPARQRTLLEQAARAAPAEDRVKLALWQVHSDEGNHLRALAAASEVSASSLRHGSARYLAALSNLELKRYDDALAILKALQGAARSAEVLNAIGVVLLRRGGATPSGNAAYYFNQAAQTDPADADYFFNLGYAHWIDRDPPAAIYWLREAVRRAPADGEAHLVLSAALQQSGATAEAARERELAARLSSAGGDASPAAAEAVPRGLERLKPYLDRPRRNVDSILTSAGQRDQAALAKFHLDAARRAFDREADTEAERELRRALYLSPYLAGAHLLMGRIHLRSGRTADAIQVLKIAVWSEETAETHVALAEAYLQAQNGPAAREAVARALVLDPSSPAAQALRDKLPPP